MILFSNCANLEFRFQNLPFLTPTGRNNVLFSCEREACLSHFHSFNMCKHHVNVVKVKWLCLGSNWVKVKWLCLGSNW